MKQATDQQLLNRFYHDGDSHALEEFVVRNRSKALQYASTFTNSDAAEDIVQIAVMRLMSAEPANRQVTNASAWWRSIVYSVAIDQLRTDSSRSTNESAAGNALAMMAREMDVEADAVRSQFLQFVREEMLDLPARFKAPLWARYVDGLTYREIADSMQLAVGTVSTRLARGLHQLRTNLASKGIIQMSSGPSSRHSPETGKIMQPLSDETIEANRRLAEKWHDLWAVSNLGIGRFTSHVTDEGVVAIKWREDCPVGQSKNLKTAYPETANERWWTENEIHMTDAEAFQWTRIETREGKVSGAEETTHLNHDIVNSGDQLTISKSGQKSDVVALAGEGPIIINPLLPLLVCERDHDSKASWPVRFLVSLREESKTSWFVIPVRGRCAGQIGRPMDMGHLFELGNDDGKMEISVLTSSTGHPKGFFWEAEGYIITEDEETARRTYEESNHD